MNILLVSGARPNFMKIAPIVRAFRKVDYDDIGIIHTGQHYDYSMSKVFFEELELPEPDYFLNAGSGSHAEQTGKVMIEFEKVCLRENPGVIVVVGDVNSTLACSIVAKKLDKRVAHVEAGLRSRDMSMPEEINRIVTDSISDLLFVSEISGMTNLLAEGKRDDQIYFTGNVMIDTLYFQLDKLQKQYGREKEDLKKYGVVTLHRPSNVDKEEHFAEILDALIEISRDMDIVFPVHPRTRKNLEAFGLLERLKSSRIELLPPLSYMEFLKLWKDAQIVLTDSGGLQEETTALGIPCFTLRDNTERPITLSEGTNVLAGNRKETILHAYGRYRNNGQKHPRVPEMWDGKAAERIVSILLRSL